MEQTRPRKERREPPAEKKKSLLAGISSLVDRKPRRTDMRSPLEGRKKNPLEGKTRLIIVALGIVLLAAILIVAASAGFNVLRGGAAATPTPEPTATPDATPEATPEPTATPEATPTVTPTPGPTSIDGPFNMHASLSASDGECLVTLKLLTDSADVDAKTLKMNIEAGGRQYADVWTLKQVDWCNADNDTVLEQGEILATIIDTSAKGIPQGVPLKISMLQNGEVLQAVTVEPA